MEHLFHHLYGVDAPDESCYHRAPNDEVRRTTKQPHLSAIVQTRRFFMFDHVAIRNRCQEDLNSLHLGELEETTRTSSYYVDEVYPSGPEIQ